MSATPADTARRLMQAAGARAIYLEEKAKRAASGRPTPPADPMQRWYAPVPGTPLSADAKRADRRARERAHPIRRKTYTPPRIPFGRDRTCGNCGDPTNHGIRGRCGKCDAWFRRYGVERSVTPRYGASKL